MTETISRINRLLEGLMSCKLEFHSVENLSPDQWNSRDLALMKVNEENRPTYIEGESSGDFGFPVNLHGSFAGLAVVRGWQGAKPAHLIQLAELLTCVLESSLAREERGDRLRLIEERLHLIEDQSNVIPMQRSRLAQALELIELPSEPVAVDAPVTSTPLLIETRPGFPLQRIAIEIHQMSARWAFLSLESLSADVLDSREGLKELGGITLFIEDISRLSAHQIEKLTEYLATKPGTDMPQVIAGALEPVANLRASGKISARLIEQMCVAELNWSDRTSEQVTTELIEASLRFILEKTRESVRVGNEPARFLPFNIQHLDPNPSTFH